MSHYYNQHDQSPGYNQGPDVVPPPVADPQGPKQLADPFHHHRREGGFWIGCRSVFFFCFLSDPSLLLKGITNMHYILNARPKKRRTEDFSVQWE